MHNTMITMKTVSLYFSALLLVGIIPILGLASSTNSTPPSETAKDAELTSIKGTCTFKGKNSDWSAKLKAKGDGTYDAVYTSSWGGKPGNYVGVMKIDLKKEISGSGKASGGRANGTFEFSGKYGDDGIAQCTYKEVNGHRSGSMTIETPRSE